MYQIVFSDVDGTLLNDNHQITPLTKKAIINIQKQDIPFVIVSARSPSGIYPILKQNQFKCCIIAYSGGLILDQDHKVIYEKGMNSLGAVSIIQYIEQNHFDLSWCVYSFDDWIVKDRKDPRIQREERIVQAKSREGNFEVVSNLSTVHKILCICNPEHILEIEKQLKEKFPEYMIVKSSPILLEIMENGISKATAINNLCQIWDIDKQYTIAFGDQYNDLEMLQTVGYGFVMGNAPKDIQELIGRVTLDNNHDGIYHALSQLEMIEKDY